MKSQSDVWRRFPVECIPSTLSIDRDLLGEFSKEKRILDMGCGAGSSLRELCSDGFEDLLGVDINEAAIAKASVDCRKNGSRIDVVVGDLRSLPFRSNVFRVAILQAVMTIIPDVDERVRVLGETFRVLSSQGVLYLADFAQTWSSRMYRERYVRGAESLGMKGTFPVFSSSSERLLYYARHFSLRELTELVTGAGFFVRTARRKHLGFRTRTGNAVDGIVLLAHKP